MNRECKGFIALLTFVIAGLTPFESAVADIFVMSTNTEREFVTIADSDTLRARIDNGRSYCMQIRSKDMDLGNYPSLKSSGPTITSEGTTIKRFRGNNAPPMGLSNIYGFLRHCFIYQSSSSSNFGEVIYSVQFNGNPDEIIARFDETTLYGGFNTVVADFNFIEVTNILTDATITGINNEITVNVRGNGNRAGEEVLNVNFTLQAGERFDVDVHSRAQNDFGPVVITHDGPKGSIKAVNSQYKVTQTTPTLDFEPVLSVPFNTRD